MGRPKAAIIDYRSGNLFSIRQACEAVGIHAQLAAEAKAISDADILILPGVGAFGDAMAALNRLDLVAPIKAYAASGKPVMGICLGLQLFMSESYEFGIHQGLNLIEGTVELLAPGEMTDGRRYKVPHVGWNHVYMAADGRPVEDETESPWRGTLLEGMQNGTFQYFVHSYRVKPAETASVLAVTRYGAAEYCSAVQRDNLFACQFHPERSGKEGMLVYENLARRLAAAGG